MANIITNVYRLNINPGGVPTTVVLNKGETGRLLQFYLVSNESFTIPQDFVVYFEGTKPDGTTFSRLGAINRETKVATIQENILFTNVAGKFDAKIKITNDTNTLYTGLIKMEIVG